jgi:fatty-acyl-CoA synthase
MFFEWKDLTINNSFEYACRTWGDREALAHGALKLTYRQLQREVFELTDALKSLGITKGTRVAYLLSDLPEWVYLFYAVFNIGAIVAPLNLTWVGREIEQGLTLTDADVLVTIDEFRGKDFIHLKKSISRAPRCQKR